MATPVDDRVQLLIGGQQREDWESYDVDSDLLIPSDAWRVTLGPTAGAIPDNVVPGGSVEVRVGGDRVMVGRIDEVRHHIEAGRNTWMICGRDGAAILVDCSAPVFTRRMVAIDELAAALTRDLGIGKIDIRSGDDKKSRLREKINVEPGDTAWHALANAAEACGLWPWFEPDGTLVIGGPDYTAPEVATLVMRRDGAGNNLLGLDKAESIAGRFSEITVYGQTHGTALEQGKHDIKGHAVDRGVTWHRPRIIVDHEADSVAVANDRARKLLADSRLKAFTLRAAVKGHRILAAGQAGDGKLWQPGQRVRVVSEPHGIDGVYFLMARRFTGGRTQGAATELVLKEDGAWVLDAHPHKRKHRRGKNDAHLQIIDASKGAAQ